MQSVPKPAYPLPQRIHIRTAKPRNMHQQRIELIHIAPHLPVARHHSAQPTVVRPEGLAKSRNQVDERKLHLGIGEIDGRIEERHDTAIPNENIPTPYIPVYESRYGSMVQQLLQVSSNSLDRL